MNRLNFERLVSWCASLGDSYSPSDEGIRLSALVAAKDRLMENITAIKQQEHAYNAAMKEQFRLSAEARTLPAKLLGVLSEDSVKRTGTEEMHISISQQLQHISLPGMEKGQTPPGRESSSSGMPHQVFRAQAAWIGNIAGQLAAMPDYKPAEKELKPKALQNIQQQIEQKSDAVERVIADTGAIIAEQDKLLYEESTGTVDLAEKVKEYILSAFGRESVEFQEISSLIFKKP